MTHPDVGSPFEDFLAEGGLLEEVEAVAIKRILAPQVSEVMKAQSLTRRAMAERIGTSRSALDRLPDQHLAPCAGSRRPHRPSGGGCDSSWCGRRRAEPWPLPILREDVRVDDTGRSPRVERSWPEKSKVPPQLSASRIQDVSVLATRSPKSSFHSPARTPKRLAERSFQISFFQVPPRSTRRPQSPRVQALPSSGAPS
jgi:hypothetical protein